jgi:hypothetical protein
VLVADLAPPLMVAVLLAAARVATGGLQMPVGDRTDPDVAPRRRNHKQPNALERSFVTHFPTVGIDEAEAVARSLAANPRVVVADVSEMGEAGIGLRRVYSDFGLSNGLASQMPSIRRVAVMNCPAGVRTR